MPTSVTASRRITRGEDYEPPKTTHPPREQDRRPRGAAGQKSARRPPGHLSPSHAQLRQELTCVYGSRKVASARQFSTLVGEARARDREGPQVSGRQRRRPRVATAYNNDNNERSRRGHHIGLASRVASAAITASAPTSRSRLPGAASDSGSGRSVVRRSGARCFQENRHGAPPEDR